MNISVDLFLQDGEGHCSHYAIIDPQKQIISETFTLVKNAVYMILYL